MYSYRVVRVDGDWSDTSRKFGNVRFPSDSDGQPVMGAPDNTYTSFRNRMNRGVSIAVPGWTMPNMEFQGRELELQCNRAGGIGQLHVEEQGKCEAVRPYAMDRVITTREKGGRDKIRLYSYYGLILTVVV